VKNTTVQQHNKPAMGEGQKSQTNRYSFLDMMPAMTLTVATISNGSGPKG